MKGKERVLKSCQRLIDVNKLSGSDIDSASQAKVDAPSQLRNEIAVDV